MPQKVDFFSIASAYGVPVRQVSCLDDLEFAFEWSLSQSGPALIRVCTNSSNDADLRLSLKVGLRNYLKEVLL